jgi:hypothetical protein
MGPFIESQKMNVGRATNGSPVFQGKMIEAPDIYNLRINSRRRHGGALTLRADVPSAAKRVIITRPEYDIIMNKSRWTIALWWTLGVTVAVEAVTAGLRFSTGKAAPEITGNWPLLLRTHHLFWGAAVLIVSWAVWKKPRLWGVIFGVGLGLVLSDAIHHFIVLPLTVGNTGWHWP